MIQIWALAFMTSAAASNMVSPATVTQLQP
jgi:hypothetical protein